MESCERRRVKKEGDRLGKWGELVLPWLNHEELANAACTCRAFRAIASSVTHRRGLDASRSVEAIAVPFHNPHLHPPYYFFLYASSNFISSSQTAPFPSRQAWGGSPSSPPVKVRQSGPPRCCCSAADGIVFECGENCGTRGGISVKMKVVWGEKKGWGLFSDQVIHGGQFICEYAGELLTTEEARKRQRTYDGVSSNRKLSAALLVVREHLPSGRACLRMNIDATRIGNVARFINHSCDGGNLSTVLVRRRGEVLPRLCFFSAREIREGEELTFSYGDDRIRDNGVACFCGSSSCFGTLPSEET